jgi:hypothetical protein
MLWANIGMPMIFFAVPMMLLALLPIALVESWVLARVCGIVKGEAWRGALQANLWSTLVGIPIAWFVLALAQMLSGGSKAWGMDTPLDRLAAVTLQAPWLIPYKEHSAWMVPAASLVLLVPFLLASVWVEYVMLCRRWGKEQRRLFFGVLLANIASYALLAAFYGVQLYLAW